MCGRRRLAVTLWSLLVTSIGGANGGGHDAVLGFDSAGELISARTCSARVQAGTRPESRTTAPRISSKRQRAVVAAVEIDERA